MYVCIASTVDTSQIYIWYVVLEVGIRFSPQSLLRCGPRSYPGVSTPCWFSTAGIVLWTWPYPWDHWPTNTQGGRSVCRRETFGATKTCRHLYVMLGWSAVSPRMTPPSTDSNQSARGLPKINKSVRIENYAIYYLVLNHYSHDVSFGVSLQKNLSFLGK